MAQAFPDVPFETQILIGKPFDCILRWVREVDPGLLILARHGSHRIDGTDLGSQAENLVRLADVNILLVGTEAVRPEDIPWIEEDGETGLEWAPGAEVRILRVPPFALGIARRAVEEFVLDNFGHGANGTYAEGRSETNGHGGARGFAVPPLGTNSLPLVTNERLDLAIRKLLPTHMQLIMGIGTAEELALAEVKAEEAMQRTHVEGSDADPEPERATITVKCPYTAHVQTRERVAADPVVWTREAFERLGNVPLIARPLARNTVERFAREHGFWRITTRVMDENREAMIAADEFDIDTMLVMFRELQSKQLRSTAEGVDGLTPEMRRFIAEAKASGVTRCPIRDVAERADQCPVDFKTVTPAEARAAVEAFLAKGDGQT
jgi:hypothetical protein